MAQAMSTLDDLFPATPAAEQWRYEQEVEMVFSRDELGVILDTPLLDHVLEPAFMHGNRIPGEIQAVFTGAPFSVKMTGTHLIRALWCMSMLILTRRDPEQVRLARGVHRRLVSQLISLGLGYYERPQFRVRGL